ncbi:two-component system sensor histidine kinase KdpD [Alicyclobacillus sacchari]|uniref:Two-component system sensor histidine kinase KdpD n=1 Tax=Alicyclobacillus sacchari TaxID=392010 RepID=A0A4R8LBF1_9BACL|nr:histidine kinase [Alicyclobacillus sacchari]TDY40221.1 two-component system sensor histidine kinase KdpD [Alicyclobacillus sacchari]
MKSSSGEVFGTAPGQLKIFIGAAPGVGKTYTMLREAVSLKERGIDVVIGYVDVHDRPETAAQIDGLEILPRKMIRFQHRIFEEVNLETIIERAPAVVVIDELAHSNAPGSMFPKRYMDVEYLLDHGISVLTTVNVQHIEGIHEEAEEITGIAVRERIPESLIKRADEVSVIDVTPETLRQRMRDGSIYPLDMVDQALQNFFRKSNLSGLRELALRVVAEDVDERLERSYSRRRIPGPVGAKEVIMVCVSHYPRAAKLIQRGHRMARRMKADLYVLTICNTTEDLLSDKEKMNLEKLKELADEYEAEWIVEPRSDRKIGGIISDVAQRLNVTQIVIGQPVSSRTWELWKDNPIRYLLRNLRYTDLRIVGWQDPPGSMFRLKRSTSGFYDSGANHRIKGRLTIYVGAAPGVGKTYKMLQDAHDWRKRGWDVVIGLIETHGRIETAEQIGDLEVIPKRRIEVEGRSYEEMDVDAIVRRKPSIVLIDELAHTNVPGSVREKRYQDIQYILEQGINVVTAVNVQHLESLHDKVEHITGVKVRERVPDWFMKLAREIKLIDVTPETLQQRLMEGKIYSRDKIESALENFFQNANLAALRELALLEVADDVDQRIYKASKERTTTEFERILVCVNHRPHSEKLIRRGWRIADRLNAELWVLVVLSHEGMSPQDERDLLKIQRLSEQFDAHFITKTSADHKVGATIVETAQELQVTELVAGQPLAPKGLIARMKMNPLDYVLKNAEFVDLHIVAYERD